MIGYIAFAVCAYYFTKIVGAAFGGGFLMGSLIIGTLFFVIAILQKKPLHSKRAPEVSEVVLTKTTLKEVEVNTFADVELSSTPRSSLYAREEIIPRTQRNPQKVFKVMRTFKTFVNQAKFMVNFTDDYDVAVPLKAYYTTYSDMDDAQLRTYFTWRTKVRQGQIEDTSLSYAFCYIYELLNNIGVANANDGIEKLITIWSGFRVHNAKIDFYLTEWVKDYFIVNCPTNSFESISNRFPVTCKTKQELFDGLNRGNWDIDLVEMYSQHKITQMSFYKNGNQKVIEDCLNAVFTALNSLFKANDVDLIDLYVSASLNGYTPFQSAVYAHGKYRDTIVKLSEYETYSSKNGNWSVHEYGHTYFQTTKCYILKTIEMEMRKALGGKQSLSPPKMDEVGIELRDGHRSWDQVKEWRKKAHELLKSKEFVQTIQSAVQAYCKTANVIVKNGTVTEIKPIEIDLSKLDKIRAEHEVTAKKLITTEFLGEETIDSPIEPAQVAPPEQTADSTGFTRFVGLLSGDEMALVVALLKSEQVPANSELLIEAINEKSLTAIDDNMIGYIDELPCLYKEYEDELRSSLGGNL